VIIVARALARSSTPTRSSFSTAAELRASEPHSELMKTCDTYQEIVYSQLTREEVA